jgi:hypothetical protein
MKVSRNNCWKIMIGVMAIIFLSIGFWGCSNVQHQEKLNKEYIPKEDVSIKGARVVNDTGFTSDIDIEKMLADALEDQLFEEDLLWLGEKVTVLFMESRVTMNKKDSAFKRSMLPGRGATELSIRCELKDDKNNMVGSAMSSREIVGGGLHTVGAWETLFKDVANDLAADLNKQIQARGYVVKIKTRPQVTDQPQEAPKLALIPKDAPVVRVSLRKEPTEISTEMEINKMLAKYGFFDSIRNFLGSFDNDFVDNNDGTVTDKATGLMWQKSGSSSSLENRGAKRYIKRLNKERFAGCSNWRMPTLEELASLLEKDKINGVHLEPVFSNRQTTCWTADEHEAARQSYRGAWIANFEQGEILKAKYLKIQTGGPSESRWPSGENNLNYVKAVRSAK